MTELNQYSQLYATLKEIAESNPMVNTVTKGEIEKLDLDKNNIFPLVHIHIGNAQFVGGGRVIEFEVFVACLTERDINKEVITDKYWGQDNEADNHNETLAMLNQMWTTIYRRWDEASEISTDEDATLEKVTYAKGNILDGWEMSFNIQVENDFDLCT